MFSRSLMCPKDVLHGTPQVVCIIHPKDVHHVPQRAQKDQAQQRQRRDLCAHSALTHSFSYIKKGSGTTPAALSYITLCFCDPLRYAFST